MIVYIPLLVVTLLLAMFIRQTTPQPNFDNQNYSGEGTRQQILNRVCIYGIFCLLFAVSALRSGIGNDYYQYRIYFQTIYKGFEDTLEPGFSGIVILLQKIFGYDQYLVVFAFFAFVTIFFFLKAIYDQSQRFAFSFFLFMAIGCYLNTFTTVRYYLALAIAVYSMKYIFKKQYFTFVFWIVIGALFHKSVLFVIPVYYVASLNWKKWFYGLLGVFSLMLLTLPQFFQRIIFLFYPFYEESFFNKPEISYTNIARALATLVLGLLYYKVAIKDNHKMQFYFQLNVISAIIYCCCSYFPLVSRLGYYCNIIQIFLIPQILSKIPDKKQRNFFTAVVILCFTVYFGLFLVKARAIDMRLVPYISWLFLP